MKSDAPTTLIQKPRRIPFALESAIENEIAKLLKCDVIEVIDRLFSLSFSYRCCTEI